MMKRFIALFGLVVIIGGAALVAAQGLQPRTTAPASVPALTYHSGGSNHTLKAGALPLIVVLFHSQCGHCHVQLDALERDVARFAGATLVLLTGEATLPAAQMTARWPRLANANNVIWGTTSASEMHRAFGTELTPAIFVFRSDGTLAADYLGQTKNDLIIRSIEQ